MVAFVSLSFFAALLCSSAAASSVAEPGGQHGVLPFMDNIVDTVGASSIQDNPLAHLPPVADGDIGQGYHRALLQKKKKKQTPKSKTTRKRKAPAKKPSKRVRRRRPTSRRKPAPKRKAGPKQSRKRGPAKKTPAKKTPAKKTPAKKTPAKPKSKPTRKPPTKPIKPSPKPPTTPPKLPTTPPKPPVTGSIESIITKTVSQCGSVPADVPTGRHLAFLTPPKQAVEEYGNLVGQDGRFAMTYKPIKRGGQYCTASGSQAKVAMFGGMIFWHNNGKCYLPPTKNNGKDSCCQMYMWQPNSDGFYYDNCSMKMDIEGDGMWWFTTEVPGDESKAGWGPDPAPHIHYDIRCSGCDKSGAYDTSKYQYWSKFYAEEICTAPQCGSVKASQHLSKETEGPGGITLFQYDFVLPAKSKGKL